MKLLAVGQEAVGVVAIGQSATGFLAIGQVATGVVAIGQLARGVVVVGQVGLGIVAVGHLLRRLFRRGSGPAFPHDRPSGRRMVAAGAFTAALAGLWWVAAGQWLLDDLTRRTEVPVEVPEPHLPCVPLC